MNIQSSTGVTNLLYCNCPSVLQAGYFEVQDNQLLPILVDRVDDPLAAEKLFDIVVCPRCGCCFGHLKSELAAPNRSNPESYVVEIFQDRLAFVTDPMAMPEEYFVLLIRKEIGKYFGKVPNSVIRRFTSPEGLLPSYFQEQRHIKQERQNNGRLMLRSSGACQERLSKAKSHF